MLVFRASPPHSSRARAAPLHAVCSRSWALKDNRASPAACTLGWLVDLISSSCISRATSTGVDDVSAWKKFRRTTKTLREICFARACSCKEYVSGTIVSSHVPELPFEPKNNLGYQIVQTLTFVLEYHLTCQKKKKNPARKYDSSLHAPVHGSTPLCYDLAF